MADPFFATQSQTHFLKQCQNIAQVEYSRHRSIENFIVNTFGALAAYCLLPQKPCINVQRVADTRLALS